MTTTTTTAAQIYFTQASLEGFASAVAFKLKVNFNFGIGQARTDGQTVYLPRITGSMTEAKFRDLCATAIHEAAHVRFESVSHHKSFIRFHHCPHKSVCAAAMNGVLDVADETAIMSYLAGAKRLLDDGCITAALRIVQNNEFAQRDKCWSIVAAGIILARVKCGKFEKYARTSPLWPFMQEVIDVLQRCKFRKYTAQRLIRWSWGLGRHRFSKEWSMLTQAASDIVDILLRAGCVDGEGGEYGNPKEPGHVHGPEDGTGDGPAYPNPDDIVGGNVAGELADGADPQTPAQNPERYKNNGNGGGNPNGAGTGSTEPASDEYDYYHMDQPTYESTLTQLRGPIQRLSEVDDCGGCRGAYASGHDIGPEIERIQIDGEVFGKREDEGENLHVTVCLDTSGSMVERIKKCQAVAQAFVDAIRPFTNSLNIIRFSHVTVDAADFRRVHFGELGGTDTGMAVERAFQQLVGCTGRRIIVIVTDGMTSSAEKCIAASILCASVGIKIIGIAYECPGATIQSTMPSGHVIEAKDANEMAMQLGRIGGMIVR